MHWDRFLVQGFLLDAAAIIAVLHSLLSLSLKEKEFNSINSPKYSEIGLSFVFFHKETWITYAEQIKPFLTPPPTVEDGGLSIYDLQSAPSLNAETVKQ